MNPLFRNFNWHIDDSRELLLALRQEKTNIWYRLFPALLWLKTYNLDLLAKDSLAALTNAVLVLPQAIAFAYIAGLPPEYGLYTAIVIPIFTALWGSSYHLISGPTTPISLLLFASLSQLAEPFSPQYVALAIALTFWVGLIQIFLALIRAGHLLNFISHSVLIGFTSAAGILILMSQLSGFLGLPRGDSKHFVSSLLSTFQNLSSLNVYSLTLGILTLLWIFIFRKKLGNAFAMLSGLVFTVIVAAIWDLSTKNVAFTPSLSHSIPVFKMLPQQTWSHYAQLIQLAIAIAFLGLLEALAIAKAIAQGSEQKIKTNQEILGQGISNLAGSFFSAYAGSGSFTRSGVNFEAGAKTPMASLLAAGFLFFVSLFLGPYISLLPVPAISAIILYVAWRLCAFKKVFSILKMDRLEGSILLFTLFVALFVGLDLSIYLGAFFSIAIFVQKSTQPSIFFSAPQKEWHGISFRNVQRHHLKECPQIKLMRFEGHLYYASFDYLERLLRGLRRRYPLQKHWIISLSGVVDMDFSTVQFLDDAAKEQQKNGGSLKLCNPSPEQTFMIKRQQRRQDRKNRQKAFFESRWDAIATTLKDDIDLDICKTCSHRVFEECPTFAELPLEAPDNTDKD